jgi:superoxide dismutase, Fe-Mn family
VNRRSFLRTSTGGAVALSLLPQLEWRAVSVPHDEAAGDVLAQRYPFTLPALEYAATAVEPAVDALTMSIHHDRHHAAYVTNLNRLLESQPALQRLTLRELLKDLAALPAGVRDGVRNNGGGHANHALFWGVLAPGGNAAPSGRLAAAVVRDFGSIPACLDALKAAGLAQFGSGWTWLVRDAGGRLTVRATPNQDTPLSDQLQPVLCVDVWEHAYYLKYQNRRAEYLDAVLARVNWTFADAAYLGTG